MINTVTTFILGNRFFGENSIVNLSVRKVVWSSIVRQSFFRQYLFWSESELTDIFLFIRLCGSTYNNCQLQYVASV
jgi:hypothetical protein